MKLQLKATPRCCISLKVLPRSCSCYKPYPETHTSPFLLPDIRLRCDWVRPAFKYCPRGTVRLGDANMVMLLLDLSQSVGKVLHVHKLTSALVQRFLFSIWLYGIRRDNNPQ